MIDPQDLDFTGRRVLVTGAASGIGAAIASAFKAHGAVLVLADRDEAALAARARELGADSHRYDQADLASIAALAEAAGPIDVLLNNAGMLVHGPLLHQEPETIREVIAVDLVGPIVLARAIGAGMVARRRGVIVNIASQLAFCGGEGRAVYASAKAGIVQFTRSMAAEWAPFGVRVVALAPGRTLTPMTRELLGTEEQRQAGLSHIPAGRYGRPEEMARLALFLASDLADYVVGATLIADGGYVAA